MLLKLGYGFLSLDGGYISCIGCMGADLLGGLHLLCGARDSDVVFAGIYFGGVECERGGISFVP